MIGCDGRSMHMVICGLHSLVGGVLLIAPCVTFGLSPEFV
jgi:hypothetical protein